MVTDQSLDGRPPKRHRVPQVEGIRTRSTESVAKSGSTKQNILQTGTVEDTTAISNPSANTIIPETWALAANHIPPNAMAHFSLPPGPLRGSIFGLQNVSFPFAAESPLEARGSLFYGSRLGCSWPHIDDDVSVQASVPNTQCIQGLEGEEFIRGEGLAQLLENINSL